MSTSPKSAAGRRYRRPTQQVKMAGVGGQNFSQSAALDVTCPDVQPQRSPARSARQMRAIYRVFGDVLNSRSAAASVSELEINFELLNTATHHPGAVLGQLLLTPRRDSAPPPVATDSRHARATIQMIPSFCPAMLPQQANYDAQRNPVCRLEGRRRPTEASPAYTRPERHADQSSFQLCIVW